MASARGLRLAVQSEDRIAYVGWVGHGNMGDEAIFDVCRRAFPEHQLLDVPYGAKFDRAARLSPRPIIAGALLGGGTLVGRYAKYRKPFERWLAAYPDVPAFALGVGVADPDFEGADGFDVGEELAAWKDVFAGFRMVTVRGPRSQQLLSEAGIRSTIVGDTGLLVAAPDQPATVRDRLLGINVGVSSRKSHTDWGRSLAEVVRFAQIMIDRGWRVRLVPVWSGDVARTNEVARSIGRGVEVARGWDRIPTLLRAIGECQVFVGIKLHSVVFASALGVPSLMLEYEPKCLDFQRSIGRERFSMPLATASAATIVEPVDELAGDHERHREMLLAAVAGRQRDLWRSIASIRASLSGSEVDPDVGTEADTDGARR